MEKIDFMMIFLSMILFFSYTQQSEKDSPLNHPRKLEEKPLETILLGFDNYTPIIPDGYKNYSINFSTYFLLKNWNDTYFGYIEKYNFTIGSQINFKSKNPYPIDFICIFNNNRTIYYYPFDGDRFDLVKYDCKSIGNIPEGVPNLINFTRNFSEGIHLNNSDKDSVSSSIEVFKKELLNLRDKTVFNLGNNFPKILRNATCVSKSPTSFKIRQDIPREDLEHYYFNGYNYYGYYVKESNNIQLLTNYNGNPKKIPCVGEFNKNKTDDEEYYYLESKGSNSLTYTDLNYAIANITTSKTGDEIFILDFKDGENSTILPEKLGNIENSGGLSTGGIIAIIIPTVIALLGVGFLVFFLARKPVVPSPPAKNLANNTMGVVASSETIVHQ